MKPTARTLQQIRKDGLYEADVVERWIPQARKRKDVAGCIDVIAYGSCLPILGIQTTSASNHSARRKKALAEPRLRAWLLAGGAFQIWSWSQNRSTRRWALRREEITIAMMEAANGEASE